MKIHQLNRAPHHKDVRESTGITSH